MHRLMFTLQYTLHMHKYIVLIARKAIYLLFCKFDLITLNLLFDISVRA